MHTSADHTDPSYSPMDILNSDLSLKDEAIASKSKRQNDNSASNEAAFHFIAFVPALGRIWKFDGLERQPQDLGKIFSVAIQGMIETTC